MIKAEHLSKAYKKQKAVDDLSFVVEPGKVTGFLGPNGAGKSTTMRLMLGLDNGRGTTTFDDKSLADYPQPSKVVGILLEAKAFHPTRTARDHLRVLAAAGNIPESRVAESLETVGLLEVADKRPGKVSLGMGQRLGIAAAILGEPKYLILDEPANGLDPEGIAWLRAFIKSYAALGNGVFISSHLLAEMAQMADNVVIIGKGRLVADKPIASIVGDSKHSAVFVRLDGSGAEHKLREACDRESLAVEAFAGDPDDSGKLPGWLVRPGAKADGKPVTTDQVGRLAYGAHLALLELSNHAVSLEQAFMELTGDSEEYKAVAAVLPGTAAAAKAKKPKEKNTV
jgi:ABC-2 type transport system ATP-binding protein